MKTNNIYFFVPNLIGYLRIIFILIAFAFNTKPVVFLSCYAFAFFMDQFDGIIARRLDQCSKFGYIMDMYTDKCATAGLFVVLCLLFPGYAVYFVYLMILDIASHSLLVYASALLGKSSHKKPGDPQHPLVSLYYKYNIVLDILWAGQEVFLLGLFALYYYPGNIFFLYLTYAAVLPFALKQIVNFFQLTDSVKWIVAYDKKNRNQY